MKAELVLDKFGFPKALKSIHKGDVIFLKADKHKFTSSEKEQIQDILQLYRIIFLEDKQDIHIFNER